MTSDHISRDHCQFIIRKGKNHDDIQTHLHKILKLNSDKNTTNRLQLLSNELWFKIYEFLFPMKNRYFLVDNGSRNGTFFIEVKSNQTKTLKKA
jgi:hypothetical protein